MKHLRACELCKGEASLYCEADSAFLCWACDASVHGANFLVARHVRSVVCAECRSVDAGRSVSGAGSRPIRSICLSCDPDGPDSPASSSSSSCISSAEATAAPAVAKKSATRRPEGTRKRWEAGGRAEAVLARWSRGLDLRSGRRCVELASHVLEACTGVMTVMPLRVCLAAALWYGIKLAEGRDGRTCGGLLRRLESCSGVPAKVIVLAESRLAGRTRVAAEEGWAECS